MIIQIAKINIFLDLKFEEEFLKLSDYQTLEEPQFEIISHLEGFFIPQITPTQTTEYFDLYKMNEQWIQIQKSNGKNIGSIVFKNNQYNIYLLQRDFSTEYLLSQYALVSILKTNPNTLFIHASSIVYQQKGILFSAKSGTGKSTQAKLWRTYTDAVSLNDDKNILVYENEKLVLYSNPWSGKHQISENITAPLSCIVFLYQSKENIIKRISSFEGLKLLLGQVEAPQKESLDRWNFMIDFILKTPIYLYGCTMEETAVLTLKKQLEEDSIL